MGAGCAGLSLLMRMLKSGKFQDKKILLVDKELKKKNDRTWCFWETGRCFFEDIVYRKWSKLDFFGDNYSATLDISPYEYKMIRAIDFYQYCFDEIGRHGNIEVVCGDLQAGIKHKEGTLLVIDGKKYDIDAGILFNSIPVDEKPGAGIIQLLQHFSGWVIETNEPVFDTSRACLMDFRVTQQYGTAFAYILPLQPNRALVEFTLFTPALLAPARYDAELRQYINDHLKQTAYTVLEKEFGIIPMTNKKFPFYRDGVFNIGAAGGQTKSSSGYTFQFIQKHSQQITDCLIQGGSLQSITGPPKRFRFYDNTLLYILYHNKFSGKRIFTRLFKKNKPQLLLRFLDNESSFREEVSIISSLPAWPFLKAALRQR